MLSDPELLNPVKDKITSDKVNAEFALKETATMFVTMFEAMDNEYMKERAADIRDVTKRVTGHLLGVDIPNPSMISEEVIIIAEDLTPSDTGSAEQTIRQRFCDRYRWSYFSLSDYGKINGNSSSCWDKRSNKNGEKQ